jgi:hypothetical protein
MWRVRIRGFAACPAHRGRVWSGHAQLAYARLEVVAGTTCAQEPGTEHRPTYWFRARMEWFHGEGTSDEVRFTSLRAKDVAETPGGMDGLVSLPCHAPEWGSAAACHAAETAVSLPKDRAQTSGGIVDLGNVSARYRERGMIGQWSVVLRKRRCGTVSHDKTATLPGDGRMTGQRYEPIRSYDRTATGPRPISHVIRGQNWTRAAIDRRWHVRTVKPFHGHASIRVSSHRRSHACWHGAASNGPPAVRRWSAEPWRLTRSRLVCFGSVRLHRAMQQSSQAAAGIRAVRSFRRINNASRSLASEGVRSTSGGRTEPTARPRSLAPHFTMATA